MFEKEVEELIQKNIKLNKTPRETVYEAVEFGYNKANEWHDLRKNPNDLPKDGVQVLSEKGYLVIYKSDCFCWFEYSPNADNIKLRKWEEPIAWKEIVLPKESE